MTNQINKSFNIPQTNVLADAEQHVAKPVRCVDERGNAFWPGVDAIDLRDVERLVRAKNGCLWFWPRKDSDRPLSVFPDWQKLHETRRVAQLPDLTNEDKACLEKECSAYTVWAREDAVLHNRSRHVGLLVMSQMAGLVFLLEPSVKPPINQFFWDLDRDTDRRYHDAITYGGIALVALTINALSYAAGYAASRFVLQSSRNPPSIDDGKNA